MRIVYSPSHFNTNYKMKGREFKDAMYDGLAKMLKAISNPARLEIIEMLSQGEKSVEGIVQATNLTIANASQHLQVLKNNNIVKARKEKQYVFYSLINDDFLSVYQHVIRYGSQEIAELEKIMNRQREDNNSQNAVSLGELEQMIDAENVLLLDVRPSVEYEFGHITGAVSIPMNDLMPDGQPENHCKRQRDYRLLPRAILRVGRRSRKTSERTGLPGSPIGRRLSGMENQTIGEQLK
ncbi:ArsR family transcriptional regulator [bacterium]|nr:ArsR family transcriptional regulator [bacterium]